MLVFSHAWARDQDQWYHRQRHVSETELTANPSPKTLARRVWDLHWIVVVVLGIGLWLTMDRDDLKLFGVPVRALLMATVLALAFISLVIRVRDWARARQAQGGSKQVPLS